MKIFSGKTVLLLGAALLLGTLSAAESKSEVWKFPLAKGARGVTLTVPDWGKEGFSAEVWCKPESTDCGYAILIRKSFGFPNFFGAKDYDNYLFTADNKNSAGRVYTKLEPGKYHYYAMTGTPTENISYRDGKLMRRNKAPGIPQYNGSPLYVGNSIGWCKKNFEGEIALMQDGEPARVETGELLFSDTGVSGIAAMQLARQANAALRAGGVVAESCP